MTKTSAKTTTPTGVKKAAKKSAAKKAGAKKTNKKTAGKELAKIKSTGGFGFTFEDKVAATLFCKMLDGSELLNMPKAQLTQVSFQVAAGCWKLDDFLLELRDDLGSLHCAISVKSAAYLTKAGFKKEFSTDAWSQRLGGAPFDPQRDTMALAVGEMSQEVSVAWTDIERRIATGTAEQLADQLTQEGSSSELERDIFKSLESTQPAPKSAVEAARLLKQLRVRHFGITVDTDGVKQCLTLLKVEDQNTAGDLWNELQQTASVLRVAGGTIDLDDLLRRLRGNYQLKAHPNYRGDWQVLNGFSQSNCDAVHSVAGSDTSVDFAAPDRVKLSTMQPKQVLGIIGDSGIGKSSLVKSYVESVANEVNLLWLTHDDLNKPSHALVSSALGLKNGIPALVRFSPLAVVFVIDAAEQLSGLALQRISEIVNAMTTTDSLEYRVIVTTQPSGWPRVRAAAATWGVGGTDELLFAGAPFDNVYAALLKNKIALALLVRPELRRVFTNLATLDQVLRVTAVEAMTPSKGWIGETEIIDWIWSHWSGSDNLQFQREALLQLLGNEDALHGPLVPLAKVGFEVKGVLGDSRVRSMLKTNAHGVRFVHEVIGDWARYEFLKGLGDARHGKILDYIKNPRWMRAIRLYSQSLLEQQDGLPAWEMEFGGFGSGDSENQIVADVFSDSLLLATNSLELLKKTWPSLIVDRAVRLKRLLKRILVVGTIKLSVNNDLDEEYAEAMEIVMRFPVPAYWGGLIQALTLNIDNVVEHCTEEAGELCDFYLRVVPPELGLGRRDLIARIALALGRKAKQSERSYGLGVSKTVFQAVLRAGHEFPDEVADMALMFAERKPLVELTSATKVVRSTGVYSRMLGRLRKPWPDGPKRRVDEHFSEAVLTGDALRPLMLSRPAIAQELILAAYIEAPQHQNEYESSMRLNDGGFAHQWKHTPAMYFSGPWLLFLRINPAYALATIIRITDFATDRWLEGFRSFNRSKDEPGYRIHFADGYKDYVGSADVYNWHRYMNNDAVGVESALMALEKWLYERSDQKEDITADINRILQESKSAAFLGLLVAVGLYNLDLFRGVLLPLFSNMELFQTQRSTLMNSTWKIGFGITWVRYGKQIAGQVQTWNEMPHRQYHLYEVARRYMLSYDEVEKHIAKFREQWEADAERYRGKDGTLPSSSEVFIRQFSRENYTYRDTGNGQVAIEFNADPKLQARLDGERERPELNLACFGIIHQARKSIDEKRVLSDKDAAEAYAQFRKIAESPSTDGMFLMCRRDAVAAGVALMLNAGQSVAAPGTEAEQYCVDHLLKLAGEEPAPRDFDSPESISDDADLFMSEAALVLILRGSEDFQTWKILLGGVFAYRYPTTDKLMIRLWEQRSDSRIRFYELATAVFLWAVVRGPASAKTHRNDPTVLQPYRDLMIKRFFRGHFKSRKYSAGYLLALNHRFTKHTLAGTPNWEWHEQRVALMATSPKMLGNRNRLHRVESYMDMEVLRYGFNFLGQFEGLRSADASALRAFFQTLMNLEMAVLPDSPDTDSDEFQNQYQFDDWLMLLASIYFATLPIEDAMNTVAKPILSLGVGAHAWIADFVKAFFRHAPSLCPTPEDLAERWRALITFANSSPRWNPENVKLHYYLDQLFRDLFGMSGHPSYSADKGLAAPLLLLRKELGEWCERWLKDPDFAAAFARFLSTAEGREIVSFSLIRLAAALPAMQNRRSRNGDLEDALSAATQHIWKVENDLVRTSGEVSEAFRSVVSFLTARLVPEAISLQAKIAES
jgi:hypothetical protein